MSQTADPKGYYQILGVPPSATAEEIRVAFRNEAKRYHPDRGSADDGQRFRQLTEAYETLRDGRRRMQYDATRTANPTQGKDKGAHRSGANDADDHPSATSNNSVISRWFGLVLTATVTLALCVTSGLLWLANDRLYQQDALLTNAYERIDQAVQEQAEIRARYRASGFMRLQDALASPTPETGIPGYVFQAELAFAANQLEIDREIRAQVDQAILDLAGNIAEIPADRDWLILLEGFAGQAAVADGVAVAAWESALLRLGSVTDYLTAQGLPHERIAVRFQAGFQPIGDNAVKAGTVEIKLLCCFR